MLENNPNLLNFLSGGNIMKFVSEIDCNCSLITFEMSSKITNIDLYKNGLIKRLTPFSLNTSRKGL